MNRDLVALYSDYLLSSLVQAGGRLFGATTVTATGLSDLLEGSISHDQITRFLSQEDFDSKTRWQLVKPMVRDIEDDDGLIFDNTIQEKPYTDENELISWHFVDHSKNRAVKGISPGSSPGQALSLPVLPTPGGSERLGLEDPGDKTLTAARLQAMCNTPDCPLRLDAVLHDAPP